VQASAAIFEAFLSLAIGLLESNLMWVAIVACDFSAYCREAATRRGQLATGRDSEAGLWISACLPAGNRFLAGGVCRRHWDPWQLIRVMKRVMLAL
jgi:hypothetical protein